MTRRPRPGRRPTPAPGAVFRGQWSQATDTPGATDLRAQHLADPPANCTCLWCRENNPDDDTQPTLFGDD